MSNPLRYEQPPKLSRCEIEMELASGDPDRIFRALLAASYTEPAAWVEEQCFKFAAHPKEMARRAAAIVLGNIAFVHGPSDLTRVLHTLHELQNEPALSTVAEESLMFVRHAARHETH